MDMPRSIGLWFPVVNGVANNWSQQIGQCTALLNRTECERYWEARTKMMEN